MLGNEKIKVVYIAAFGRSGSTVLSQVLGQLPSFFFAGELRGIWEYSLSQNRLCGCGRAFKDCDTWLSILDAAYGGIDKTPKKEIVHLMQKNTRNRHMFLMLLAKWKPSILTSRLGICPEALYQLYHGIRSTTGSRVIVDSSKSPMYGFILGTMPEIELSVIHLVRDSRGVANSWRKLGQLQQPDPTNPVYMNRSGYVKTSLFWSLRNLIVEAYWRRSPHNYLLVRYEDFVQDPERTIRQIVDLTGEPVPDLPFINQREVQIDANHGVWGNPSRFKSGSVQLRLDDEWKRIMQRGGKLCVTALTSLLLLRYGYKLDWQLV